MGNPPNDKEKELYEKLYVSSMDIAFAQNCAKYILKKKWHSKPWERRGTLYFQQSVYMTALVVSYGRAFTKSKGWPNLPQRLLRYFQEEKELHNKLLALRNSVYAHSDSGRYSIRPVDLREYGFSDIVGAPFLMITRDEAEQFLDMAGKALSAIGERKKEMLSRFQRDGRLD